MGGVALAVSLDIANAFNSIPWAQVGRAMEYHQVPPYLRAIVGDYFRGRALSYVDREQAEGCRAGFRRGQS